jgi:LPS O-antigen subunit length determinant protein (WzzB/FepE family)
MAQDVRQWLDEIKRLQQQLTEASRDRDEASESAAQWRQLYNTEAEQRRNDVKLTQQTIANLEAQIQQLQTFSPIASEGDEAGIARQQEVEKQRTVGELKAKLVMVLSERDRAIEQIKQLTQALQQEQTRHAETSKNLTTALGDAIDLLTKAQNPASVRTETVYSLEIVPTTTENPGESAIEIRQTPAQTGRNPAQLPPAKNQLLQLPPFSN